MHNERAKAALSAQIVSCSFVHKSTLFMDAYVHAFIFMSHVLFQIGAQITMHTFVLT